MNFPHGITVERLRGTPTTDGYGNTVIDWTDPDTLEIGPCAIAPLVDDELLQRGRQAVTIAWTLYCPHGSDITAQDRINAGGVPYEVDGHPGNWRSPYTGRKHGMTVRLARVEG